MGAVLLGALLFGLNFWAGSNMIDSARNGWSGDIYCSPDGRSVYRKAGGGAEGWIKQSEKATIDGPVNACPEEFRVYEGPLV